MSLKIFCKTKHLIYSLMCALLLIILYYNTPASHTRIVNVSLFNCSIASYILDSIDTQ